MKVKPSGRKGAECWTCSSQTQPFLCLPPPPTPEHLPHPLSPARSPDTEQLPSALPVAYIKLPTNPLPSSLLSALENPQQLIPALLFQQGCHVITLPAHQRSQLHGRLVILCCEAPSKTISEALTELGPGT